MKYADIKGVGAPDDQHRLPRRRAVVVLAVRPRARARVLGEQLIRLFAAGIAARQHIVHGIHELRPEQLLPFHRARRDIRRAAFGGAFAFADETHTRGVAVLHRTHELLVQPAHIVDIFLGDYVRAYLHALPARLGLIGADGVGVGELALDGGHLHRLVDIYLHARARDLHGHGGQDLLLHLIHVEVEPVGHAEHQRDADYAYAARDGGEDGARLFGDEIARAEPDRRKQRHGSALPLFLGLTAALFELFGLFGGDQGDELVLFVLLLPILLRAFAPLLGGLFAFARFGLPFAFRLRLLIFGALLGGVFVDIFLYGRAGVHRADGGEHGGQSVVGIAVSDDLAVAKLDYAGGVAPREFGIVRDHDDELVVRDLGEQVHDLHAGHAVQRSRGLVGEDGLGIADDGARDGDALHLSARELSGLLLEHPPEPHADEGVLGKLTLLFARHTRDGQGEFDILKYGEMGDEIVALKDETHRVIAVGIPVARAEILGRAVADDEIAVRVVVEPADDVEKGGLAAARGTQDGDELAPAEIDADPFQRMHDGVARDIVLFYIDKFKHRTAPRRFLSGRDHYTAARAPCQCGRASRGLIKIRKSAIIVSGKALSCIKKFFYGEDDGRIVYQDLRARRRAGDAEAA